MDKNNILTVSFLKQYKGKTKIFSQLKENSILIRLKTITEVKIGMEAIYNFIFDVTLREKCMVR